MTLAVTVILLVSCKKEITKPDSKPQTFSTSNGNTVFTGKEDIIYPIDETDYDECTSDTIHFTGLFRLTFNYSINGNIINSTTELNFEDVQGISLLTGIHYMWTGHFTDEERGLLPGNGTIDIFNQNVTAKTMFVSSNGNNLFSTFNIHILGNVDSIRVDRETFIFGCGHL